jgi:hypothetical protein
MLKKGKEEIIYLLNKAIEKFQQETGQEIVQNTNRKNYESLAVYQKLQPVWAIKLMKPILIPTNKPTPFASTISPAAK